MKFVRKLLWIVTIALAVLATVAEAEEASTKTFDFGPLKATVTPPAGWTVSEGAPPSFFDMNGKKGSISFVGTPMAQPDATFAAMHKAALDAGLAKVKTGDYEKAEEHAIDGLKGILTIESGKDPSIRRMQWVAYGHGGFYTIMMASQPDAFEGYRGTFEAFLQSVKLK